jgi:cysteinyl-tRNA synthetase
MKNDNNNMKSYNDTLEKLQQLYKVYMAEGKTYREQTEIMEEIDSLNEKTLTVKQKEVWVAADEKREDAKRMQSLYLAQIATLEWVLNK